MAKVFSHITLDRLSPYAQVDRDDSAFFVDGKAYRTVETEDGRLQEVAVAFTVVQRSAMPDESADTAERTYVDFVEEDLDAAGLGLAAERAEAAVLDFLEHGPDRHEYTGYPFPALTGTAIDELVPARIVGAGSDERVQCASGWCFFIRPAEDVDAEDEFLADVYAFKGQSEEFPEATATGCAGWLEARYELGFAVPKETLDAVSECLKKSRSAWAGLADDEEGAR